MSLFRAVCAVATLLLMPLGAHAQSTLEVPQRIGAFGEASTYELTNIFSLQSTFGTSTLRDVETTANGATISLDGGYIQLQADSQSGSTAQLDTVERGQYQPGKMAEAGIAVLVVTAPTSDGQAEWGLGDGDNGAFWRLKGNGDFCVVYERATTEQEFCGTSLNGANADQGQLNTEKGKRVPLIGTQPTCAIGKVDANTATVDTTLRVIEEF